MKSNFRKNLRAELNYQGITVEELSSRTGIPVATLDCYLGARATMPAVDVALKIAQALQVSVEYLVSGEKVKTEELQNEPSRELEDIISWINGLEPEQCRAILKMLKTFKQ